MSALLDAIERSIARAHEAAQKARAGALDAPVALEAAARELLEAAQALRQRDASRASPPPPSGASDADARPVVVVVEDQEDNRIIYRRTLRKAYTLIEVEDGAEAVRVITERRPDLVLMDISLPVMDGLEATRLLRGEPETARIPIVLVTAHAMKGNREEALAAGADDFLTKPFSPSALRQLVHRFVSG